MNTIRSKRRLVRIFGLTLTLSLTMLTVSCFSQSSSSATNVQNSPSPPETPATPVKKFKCLTVEELQRLPPLPERSGGALSRAVLKRDVAAVKNLLQQKADPNEKDNFGDTPLILSVSSLEILEPAGLGGSPEMRQRNVEKEAQAQIAIVRELLKYGANPNLRGNGNRTALMQVSAGGFSDHNPEITNMLIKEKADVNLQDDRGSTALMNAVFGNSPELVKLLLAHGANPDLVGCDSSTALSIAQERKNSEIVLLLQNVKR